MADSPLPHSGKSLNPPSFSIIACMERPTNASCFMARRSNCLPAISSSSVSAPSVQDARLPAQPRPQPVSSPCRTSTCILARAGAGESVAAPTGEDAAVIEDRHAPPQPIAGQMNAASRRFLAGPCHRSERGRDAGDGAVDLRIGGAGSESRTAAWCLGRVFPRMRCCRTAPVRRFGSPSTRPGHWPSLPASGRAGPPSGK